MKKEIIKANKDGTFLYTIGEYKVCLKPWEVKLIIQNKEKKIESLEKQIKEFEKQLEELQMED